MQESFSENLNLTNHASQTFTENEEMASDNYELTKYDNANLQISSKSESFECGTNMICDINLNLNIADFPTNFAMTNVDNLFDQIIFDSNQNIPYNNFNNNNNFFFK